MNQINWSELFVHSHLFIFTPSLL